MFRETAPPPHPHPSKEGEKAPLTSRIMSKRAREMRETEEQG
jgi:hypothetical protein